MSVDFRHLHGYDDLSLEEAKQMFPLFTDEHLRRYISLRFMPRNFHMNPYCPKPNEPDDVVQVQR